MSVLYRLESREFTNSKGETKKISYARTMYTASTPLDYFTTMIARISAISPGDVKSVLDTLSQLVGDQLALGNIVDLGDLGRLRPSIRSKSVAVGEEFTLKQMQGFRVIFVPGRAIKQSLKVAGYRRHQEETETSTQTPHSGGENETPSNPDPNPVVPGGDE